MVSPNLTAAEKRLKTLRARAAARKRVSAPGYDGQEATLAMRVGYWQRLMLAVDPDHCLTEVERLRRAKTLWQARMDSGKANKLAGDIRTMRRAG